MSKPSSKIKIKNALSFFLKSLNQFLDFRCLVGNFYFCCVINIVFHSSKKLLTNFIHQKRTEFIDKQFIYCISSCCNRTSLSKKCFHSNNFPFFLILI